MEKPWLKRYPPGVPEEIDPAALPTLVALLEQACARHADRIAFFSLGAALTYRELERQSAAFAAWLQSIGVAKGDRVALMLPNLLQFPVALLGILRAGCVAVPCNPLYTPRELAQQLADAHATVIVALENFAHTLEAALPQTTIRHVVITSVGELLGPLKGRAVDFVLRHVKKSVPAWRLPAAIRFSAALAAGRRRGFHPVEVVADDLAFLQYTGGTTGVAKGAMLTHGNVAANVAQAHAWVSGMLHEGEELVLTALPLYHIFALTANLFTFLRLGARNLLIANARDIASLVKAWRKHPVTVITGVNTLFNALLEHPAFARLDFAPLKVSLGGGMAVHSAVAARWKAVTGVPLLQAYGLTEASPAVTVDPLDLPEFNGSIGLPLPSTELVIRDDAGRNLPLGQIGELCVRGPQVMRGYWQRPDETALVFHADGFLRTGDLGYIDAEGFVYLVDRKKDVILVSGFNVYPNEVEEAAMLHPGVREAAAIGVPDARSGEAVKLFVVRKDMSLDAAALLTHCRTVLAPYKVPRYVEFCDSLPHTAVGKVLRRALREHRS
ncbi:MAG: AMP-binding protein [Rhodocyclaceae bacterium]|nr:AMP-binding protein [Rhodocyclaceae bacterium]